MSTSDLKAAIHIFAREQASDIPYITQKHYKGRNYS